MSLDGQQIFEKLIVTLVASAIIYALQRVFSVLRIGQTVWLLIKIFVAAVLLTALLGQIYYIWSLTPEGDTKWLVLERIGLAFLIQIVCCFSLYFIYKAQKRQFTAPFPVKVPSADGKDIDIRISQFKQAQGLPDGDRLQLTWETFGHGLDTLENQIRGDHNKYTPDLCIGVNPSGLLIASYLTANIWNAIVPIGYVCIEKDGEGKPRILHMTLPKDVSGVRSILVFDSEFKSGKNLKFLTQELRKDKLYGPEIQLRYSAMWACAVRRKIKNMTELQRGSAGLYEVDSNAYLPRYLAFTAPSRVWKPGKIH